MALIENKNEILLLDYLRKRVERSHSRYVQFNNLPAWTEEVSYETPVVTSDAIVGVLLLALAAKNYIKIGGNDVTYVSDAAGKVIDVGGTLEVEILEPRRPSLYHAQYGYKSLRDVLLDFELKKELVSLIKRAYGVDDESNIRRYHSFKVGFNKKDSELVLLLEELGVAKSDWDGLSSGSQQTAYFDGKTVRDFLETVRGKKSRIKPRVLELMASNMKNWLTGPRWKKIFKDHDVPESAWRGSSSKEEMLYAVMVSLASTGDENDWHSLLGIYEETVDPLTWDGDNKKTAKAQSELSNRLLQAGLCFIGDKIQPIGYGPSAKSEVLDDHGAEQTESANQSKFPPHCLTEGRLGYLKYNKYGKRIKIGLTTSRQFRLLQCLIDPFGTPRTVDSVFDAISIERDKKDDRLCGIMAASRKKEIINFVIKDLQKGGKISRLKFSFEQDNIKVELRM